MDTFKKFEFDHLAVRKLFLQFRQALQKGDMHQARRLQQTIFHELRVDKASKEETFYPAAEQAGEEAEALVKKDKEELQTVEWLMEQVQRLDIGDAEFVAKMTALIDEMDRYAAEEERELLPKLREALGDERLDQITGDLEQARRRQSLRQGPTHG